MKPIDGFSETWNFRACKSSIDPRSPNTQHRELRMESLLHMCLNRSVHISEAEVTRRFLDKRFRRRRHLLWCLGQG
jgi:hypothetical protein